MPVVYDVQTFPLIVFDQCLKPAHQSPSWTFSLCRSVTVTLRLNSNVKAFSFGSPTFIQILSKNALFYL